MVHADRDEGGARIFGAAACVASFVLACRPEPAAGRLEPDAAPAVLEAEQVAEPAAAVPSDPIRPVVVTAAVGPTVARHIVPLERRPYPLDELEQTFVALRAASEPLCAHRRLDARRRLGAIQAYVDPPALFLAGPRGSKYGAMAGCWNFVAMNDRRPDRDFRAITALVGADHYDCAAVGLMQPYLMMSALGCRSLTVVDLDWRIHDLHVQLLRLAQQGALRDATEVFEAVERMTTAWVALAEPLAEQRPSLAGLCPEPMTSRCAGALVDFGRAVAGLRGLEALDFQVASLHDATYPAGPPGSALVVYASNALEPGYTTAAQRSALLENLGAHLTDGRRVILVHHAGGSRRFGLYELVRREGALEVRTLCKDPYPVVSRRAPRGSTYNLAFDRPFERAPSCLALAGEDPA